MATNTKKRKNTKRKQNKSRANTKKKSTSKKGLFSKNTNARIAIIICSAIVLFLIIASIVLIKSNYGKSPNEIQFNQLNVHDSVAQGIDVSSHNGKIDWEKASKDLDFVIIRVGYSGYANGESNVDKKAKRNMKQAAKYNVPFGVYYYSQATTKGEAIKEANEALKVIKGYEVKLPVFIDYEFAESKGSACGRLYNAGLSKAQKTDVINAFCKTVKDAGYTPGVYANTYFYKSLLKPDKIDKDAIIWIAQYNDEVTYKGNYDIWQYSKSGKWQGIKSNDVDMNYWYSHRGEG